MCDTNHFTMMHTIFRGPAETGQVNNDPVKPARRPNPVEFQPFQRLARLLL
jgi:hypothetical protein